MKFFARKDWGGFHVEIHAFQPTGHEGDIAVASPITLTVKKREEQIYEPYPPMMAISPDDAQRLIDALWDVGLRPSEGTGSAGSLAATQVHLSDMRKIVSHNLGVQL